MSQTGGQSMFSSAVHRSPLAYVFIEGKQIARDNAYLVLKTETGSSPALATRQTDISLPHRHILLVYSGNSTEPKFSVLLATSKETPARVDPVPLIRYSQQRQYLLIYNELGSTQSPSCDLRFTARSSLEEAITTLRRIGITPLMDDMELPSPVTSSSFELGRRATTSSPSWILSANDLRAGKIPSPFQRRPDGSTPPFALKRVHSIQGAGPAMSGIDIGRDESRTSMAQRSRSTTTPGEQGLATHSLRQTSSQNYVPPSKTLPILEEERPDDTVFPIPNLDAGLGQSSLNGRGAQASRPLKRRKGNRSQRQVLPQLQPESSALTTITCVSAQSSAKFERDEDKRKQYTTHKTALEAQNLLSHRRGGPSQYGEAHSDVGANMSKGWTSLYESYVWEELRDKLFSDVDRVSDHDLTLQLLVDRYERDLVEKTRDMSRS